MIAILTTLLLAAPAPAPAVRAAPAASFELGDAELAERVDAYLRSFHAVIDADDWKALGPKAVPLLEQIAADPASLPTRRAQALAGLAAIQGAAAAPTLAGYAAREDVPVVVRLSAVRALGAGPKGADAAGRLEAVLHGAGDARVRAVAAEQLAATGAGGCRVVLERVRREGEASRPMFARAVGACAHAAEARSAAPSP